MVKSHVETSQYNAEELKRMAWTMYSPEETRSYQIKVYMIQMYDRAVLFIHTILEFMMAPGNLVKIN